MKITQKDVVLLLITHAAFLCILFAAGCPDQPEAHYIGVPDQEWVRSASMAVEEINATGGVRGKELRMVAAGSENRDTREQIAATIADKLSSDPAVLAVIGHYSSGDSLVAGHIYSDRQVVNIVPSGSSPLLTRLGDWIFRMSVSDEAQGKYCAEVAYRKLGFDNVGVVFRNDDYGKHLARVFIDRLSELGGKVCYVGWYSLGKSSTLATICDTLLKLNRSAGCKSIFFAGEYFGLESLLKKFSQSDAEATILCGDGCFVVRYAQRVEQLSGRSRVFASTFYDPNVVNGVTEDFVDNFRERFGVEAESLDALVYDAVYLLAEAIENGGGDRRSIREYLRSVGRSRAEFQGVTGTLGFYNDGESKRPVTILEYKPGFPVIKSERISPPGR